MVSKASEDLPDPLTPVTTVIWLCGISKSMFLRLWTRQPRTHTASEEGAWPAGSLPDTLGLVAVAIAKHFAFREILHYTALRVVRWKALRGRSVGLLAGRL